MKAIIPIKIVKLEDGLHLLISIRINGKKGRVLIDTGASHTVFDKSKISRFLKLEKLESHEKLSTGLGTNAMKSHLVVIEKIEIGRLPISKYKSVVIDLSHVNTAYAQLKIKPIDGVLGSDLLRKYQAVIDYGKRKLTLVS